MELTIKMDEQDVQLVLQALGELPLKVSLNTFLKINRQAIEQKKSGEGSNADVG